MGQQNGPVIREQLLEPLSRGLPEGEVLLPQTVRAGLSAILGMAVSRSARYPEAAMSCRGAIAAGSRRPGSRHGAKYICMTSVGTGWANPRAKKTLGARLNQRVSTRPGGPPSTALNTRTRSSRSGQAKVFPMIRRSPNGIPAKAASAKNTEKKGANM